MSSVLLDDAGELPKMGASKSESPSKMTPKSEQKKKRQREDGVAETPRKHKRSKSEYKANGHDGESAATGAFSKKPKEAKRNERPITNGGSSASVEIHGNGRSEAATHVNTPMSSKKRANAAVDREVRITPGPSVTVPDSARGEHRSRKSKTESHAEVAAVEGTDEPVTPRKSSKKKRADGQEQGPATTLHAGVAHETLSTPKKTLKTSQTGPPLEVNGTDSSKAPNSAGEVLGGELDAPPTERVEKNLN